MLKFLYNIATAWALSPGFLFIKSAVNFLKILLNYRRH